MNGQDATIVASPDARPPAKTLKLDASTGAASDSSRRRIAVGAGAAAVALLIVTVFVSTMLRRTDVQTPDATRDNGAPTASLPVLEPPASAAPSANAAAGSSASGAGPSAPPATVKNADDARNTPAPSTPTAARVDNAPASEVVTAKQLYDAPAGGETGKPGLKYRIIEQRGTGEADADPSKVFHSGDRVRFAFESNIDGYLYVVQAGSSGRWTVLFPNPGANGGRNAIVPAETYLVPDNGWFRFDETPGTEEVFVVVSKRALDTLPGFNAPVTHRETVDQSTVTGLQASIRPRDLLFEKDQSFAADGKAHQATYIVNRSELASQVAALIQLSHAK